MTDINTLYYGDNLDIMKRYIKDETIDLVYLDPPFNSNANYNVLFGEQDGTQAASQIKAFDDTWHWDQTAAAAYAETVKKPGQVSLAMQAFHTILGNSTMLAYLAMMAPRLVELRRVMKPTASIYLHCDPTASHYLKLLMDAIFGADKLLNEIVWSYKRYTAKSNRFQRLHDIILFYSRSTKQTTFHDLRDEYGEKSGKADSHYKQDEDDQWYRWQKRRGEEPYKIYLSEGKRLGDVWEIPLINASAKERLGYPTQKPLALLERIINASSNPGDVILDPFCGCGTAVAAAQKLGRKWIGIDITHLAVNLMKHRLIDGFGQDLKFNVIGEPTSIPDAQTLAASDPYQFQWWALGLVGARPVDQKKGADKGIDGRLVFLDEGDTGKAKQVIISVKAGHTNVTHLRDLRGVIEREKAEIGILITMEEPTKPMRVEAASAGFYDSPWGSTHPRLQLLTVAELLDGRNIDMPASRGNVTFKKADKIIKSEKTFKFDL